MAYLINAGKRTPCIVTSDVRLSSIAGWDLTPTAACALANLAIAPAWRLTGRGEYADDSVVGAL